MGVVMPVLCAGTTKLCLPSLLQKLPQCTYCSAESKLQDFYQHTRWLCIRTEALYLCLLCGDCSLSLFDHFWHFMHGRFQFFLIPINHHRTEGCQESHITMTLELRLSSATSVSEFIQYRLVFCLTNSNSQILIT